MIVDSLTVSFVTPSPSISTRHAEFSVEWQILTTESWGLCLTALVAVFFTLTAAHVFRLLSGVRVWIINLTKRKSQVPSQARQSGEAQPLLTQPAQEYGIRAQSNPPTLEHSVVCAKSSRETFLRFGQYILQYGTPTKAETAAMFVITILMFAAFVAINVAGIFSVKIASEGIGISSSDECGIWEFDKRSEDDIIYREQLYDHLQESKSSQYARNCYASAEPEATLGTCNVFYNQSIAYKAKSRQICPFASSELCLDGLYSAVAFDTGYVSAGVIGVNSPHPPIFRRKTTCSPLNETYPYIRNDTSSVGNDTTYYYHYGSTDSADYTFRTSSDPFKWLAPSYTIK